jgi:VRR-NUC domain
VKIKESVPLEEDEQKDLAQLLDSMGLIWFHVPNEIKCKPQYYAKRKMLGVKSGVPDNFIINIPPKFPQSKGAVIELKRKKGGVTSEEQLEWLSKLSHKGWRVAVCHGKDECINQLIFWGYLKEADKCSGQ